MAGNDDLQSKLQDGIAAARSGDRATGRRLLEQVTNADPNNELAWFWLALCVPTVSERRNCLERVLAINPNNQRAKQALQQLNAENASSAPSAQDMARMRQVGQAAGAGSSTDAGQRSQSNAIILIVVLLVLVAGAAGTALFLGGDLLAPDPTDTPTPSNTRPPTRTPFPSDTPGPSPTLIFFLSETQAATLPPTFTPIPSRTFTPGPDPTNTSVPLVEQEALVLSQSLGEVQPALYRISGDGTNEERVDGEYRDIVYDIGGVNVAFVRDVEYVDSETEDVSTFPELFIAPADDLGNVTQITELRSTLLASPSFSPEGGELVFVSNFNGSPDIWYTTITGEGQRRLTENGEFIDTDPAWRPVLTSREIVFVTDQNTPGRTKLSRLYVVGPDEPVEVEQLSRTGGEDSDPAWSDLGDVIAYISTTRGDADLYITDDQPGGGLLLTVSDDGAEDRAPDFTPDGRFIAFVSNRLDDRFQTYVISLDGDVITRVTESNRDDLLFIYRPDLLQRLP